MDQQYDARNCFKKEGHQNHVFIVSLDCLLKDGGAQKFYRTLCIFSLHFTWWVLVLNQRKYLSEMIVMMFSY